MVLLDHVVQVFRRAQLGARGQRAIGLQLTHCTVRCGVAIQRDCPRAALLAFDRFTKERLGCRHIAPGAQPEVDRPTRPVNGPVQVAPLASDLDVGLVDHSAIIGPNAWAIREVPWGWMANAPQGPEPRPGLQRMRSPEPRFPAPPGGAGNRGSGLRILCSLGLGSGPCGAFAIQPQGTSRIAQAFGPIMALWSTRPTSRSEASGATCTGPLTGRVGRSTSG